jgi:hypothetical protein
VRNRLLLFAFVNVKGGVIVIFSVEFDSRIIPESEAIDTVKLVKVVVMLYDPD